MRGTIKKPGVIRAAILDWLGVPFRLSDSGFFNELVGSRAGQDISENTVLSLSAAWACTRLISETIGTLPLKLYEKGADGRTEATNHPLYRILHSSPNADSTSATYLESKVSSIILRGNAFSEKLMIGNRLVGIRFLPPHRLSRDKGYDGNTKILFIEDNNSKREIKKDMLFHIPGFSLDGRIGVSAISYGASVFGSALAASTAANSMFEKGLSPTVAFTLDKVLKADQREEFRENLKKITGAINAGESPLLEGGMDAKTIGITPSDAQLLESRNYSVEEVCRWFRVDPSMVGHGGKDSNFGTGLEQKMIGFLSFTLRPWLTRIEQAINKNLLSPADQERYYAEFSISALLRADSAARSAFYSVMVNNGIFTRDEVRKLENMPLKGGNADVLTVQTAMAPLDSIGQLTDGDAARNALAAWIDKEGVK